MCALEQELRNQLTGEQLLMFDALIKRETRNFVIMEEAMDISSCSARWDYIENTKFETNVKDSLNYTALTSRLMGLDICISMVDEEGDSERFMVEGFDKAEMPKSAIHHLEQAVYDYILHCEESFPEQSFMGIELSILASVGLVEQSGILSLKNMKAYLEQHCRKE